MMRIAVDGPSGAGKSTFIKLILKEIDADSGSIKVRGNEITTLSNRQVPKLRRNIGIVFQDFRLLPKKTVYENVAFAMEIIHQPKKIIKKYVPQVLSMVGIASKADKYPDELSAGEQQRVAIARALINNPVVLLADEPTGNLDAHNSMEIMGLLEQINRRGTTVVVVTHSHEIVERMGKRVITIDRGTVISDEVMPPWDYGELQVDELHTRHGESGQDLGWYGGKWKRGASGAGGGTGPGAGLPRAWE